MNKRIYYGALAVCATLASCSSEDPIDPDTKDDGEKSYLSVNIVSPSRTKADDDYENGTTDENEAKQAVFLFYDEQGNSTQSPQLVDLTWNGVTSTSPQVEKISEATVVIAGAKEPSQMIVILNPPENYYASVNGYGASTIRSRRSDYSAHEKGKFIMTNSVYVETKAADGTALPEDQYYEVFTTDIKGKAKKTIESASANPVNVYVERTVAKVRTSKIDASFTNGDQDLNLSDGGKTKVVAEIEGIEIANTAKSTFLLKDITGWKDWDWTLSGNKYAWNDPDNKRCYWTTTPQSLEFNNLSWSAISEPTMTGGAANPDYRDPSASAQTFYIMANTHPSINTSVLVTATIKKKNADGTTEPLSFLRWGGKYYEVGNNPRNSDGTLNEDYKGFLTQYAIMVYGLGYRIEYNENGETKYRSIKGNELSWITAEEHERYVNLTDALKFQAYETTAKLEAKNIPGLEVGDGKVKLVQLKADGTYDGTVTVANLNNDLRRPENRVWMWNEGKCYYYVDIDHFGPNTINRDDSKTQKSDFSKGVVRNHIYDLTLKSLTGFGTPVFNPDEVIIPNKPADDLWYLAAKLNILKWRLVKQDVEFK